MEKIKAFFEENDLFAKQNGMKILDVKEGFAKVSMKTEKHHLNGAGTVHGGVIFSLADFAFAIATNSYKKLALAVNASIQFMKPGFEGNELRATAQTESQSTKLGHFRVTVKNENEELIAVFQGTAYNKNKNIIA